MSLILEASLPSFLPSLSLSLKNPFNPFIFISLSSINTYYYRIRKKKLAYLLLFISIIYFDVCQFRYYKALSL